MRIRQLRRPRQHVQKRLRLRAIAMRADEMHDDANGLFSQFGVKIGRLRHARDQLFHGLSPCLNDSST